MLSSLRTIRQDQVKQTLLTYLPKAKAAVLSSCQIVEIMVREEAIKAIFFRLIRELETEIVDSETCVVKLTSVSGPVDKHLIQRVQGLGKRIHTIYRSVLQSGNFENSVDVNLILDLTKDLESIVVDESTPEYAKHTQLLTILTPFDIDELGEEKKSYLLVPSVSSKRSFNPIRFPAF